MDDRTKKKIWSFANDIASDAEKDLRHARGAIRETLEENIRKARMIMQLTTSHEELETRAKSIMSAALEDEPDLSATDLAELAADELEMDEALDDSGHPMWDWALDVHEAGTGGYVAEEEDED